MNTNALTQARALTLPSRQAVLERASSVSDFYDKASGKTVQTNFESGKAMIHKGAVPRYTSYYKRTTK